MKSKKVIIIGAGIGGLVAANLLSKRGFNVNIYEKNKHPGGKLRAVDSSCGLIDAGPTVFTFKEIFEEIFELSGESLCDHLKIEKEPIIARHFWPDGSKLDLHDNFEENCEAIKKFAGLKVMNEFINFNNLTADLFNTFNKPIIYSSKPNLFNTSLKAYKKLFKFYNIIKPKSNLWSFLDSQFSEPKLKQLFARYSTYVGGSPFNSPALLSLIWEAEKKGVWRISGGLHLLAKKLMLIAEKNGASFHFNTEVKKLNFSDKKDYNIITDKEENINTDYIIFNGDPRALHFGLINRKISNQIINKNVIFSRSLSAYVWSFCSKINEINLQHHNVFFNEDYKSEFKDIEKKLMPSDPTLYVCAEDRGFKKTPPDKERFEIIMNAAPYCDGKINLEKEYQLCYSRTFSNLKEMGLIFQSKPKIEMLTTPQKFNKMFPMSQGSLYGQSPNSIMTTFRRPRTKTKVPKFFLVGGGVHPGPGVPMAALSGMHAAEEILKNQTSI